ncbi:ABC transporter substrate-binding protein [Selenihalanaerobacter shriftii]|uniref:Putative ABC transport system substrate-binding protein n=1 Tax=Selenihalanaerobacter shriftii TaxID=142842 RepID=A0A1T4JLB7_9FIRM|nr:ABC transporter substrate-binding protein [Selenihalanaerobacter shriftii]SJZ30974.1 putative ABC transport system substrate-binding protein [Selenihalanaerobacter shriftii]
MRNLVRNRLTFVVLILTLALVITGCGQQSKDTETSNDKLKIGIIQIVEHPALDAARKGFIDSLTKQGYKEGEDVVYDYQNAQGDMSTAQTIAKQFKNNQVDMILAIATPTAQAAANVTSDIPILITAVTDPKAAGLVKNLKRPGTNVTGTSDLTPVRKQLQLLKKIKPNIQNIGIIYNAGETNSVVQAKIAEKAAKDLGLNLENGTVSTTSDVLQATQTLIGKVDAFYVPTDNTVASAIEAVVKVASEEDLPLVVGEEGMVERGALATIGINYYKLGKQTGEMAVKVIKGADPAQMPIEYLKTTELIINKDAAEKMNVSIPQEILDNAKEVLNNK